MVRLTSTTAGDIILKVDDEDVNVNNITDKLVGSDIPGSFVKLLVFSPGGPQKVPEEKEVILTRMATVTIADNVRMFEIFAALKVGFAPLVADFLGHKFEMF